MAGTSATQPEAAKARLGIARATPGDVDDIIRIWYQGWHDAHAHLVPPEILPFRTHAHLRTWLEECRADAVVGSASRGLIGFYALDGAELAKLFVGREARGSGAAAELLAHAERTLADRGVETARVYCTAGNRRAERFYTRGGWRLEKTFLDALWMPGGAESTFKVETHLFLKSL